MVLQPGTRLFPVNNFVHRMVYFSTNGNIKTARMQTADMLNFLKIWK